MAVYAIGDIQGCHDEFRALLERLAFDPGRDVVWLTGDLVARGPDSLGVLRTVRGLGDAAVTVLGNHDLHLLAIAASGVRKRRDAEFLPVLEAADSAELLDWLAHRPLLHRDRRLGWTLLHAGLPPQWTLSDAEGAAREVERALQRDRAPFLQAMYGDEPSRWSDTLAGSERLRFIVNCLTRLRYVDGRGDLLLGLKCAPDEAPATALPWFRHPGRRTAGERIVFGHWSTLGHVAADGAVGIDTGCVWGGSLCAVRLDQDAAPCLQPCARHQPPGAP